MKKLILAGALALLGATTMSAQRVVKGETQLNAGVGFSTGDWGVPVYAGVDYGVHKDITVGAEASYSSAKLGSYGYKIKSTWFGVGVNANYHFNSLLKIPNKWDVYAGINLAYNNFSYDYPNGIDGSRFGFDGSGIGFGAQIGGRYYFTDNLGVNLQFGGGSVGDASGRVGISYKF